MLQSQRTFYIPHKDESSSLLSSQSDSPSQTQLCEMQRLDPPHWNCSAGQDDDAEIELALFILKRVTLLMYLYIKIYKRGAKQHVQD